MPKRPVPVRSMRWTTLIGWFLLKIARTRALRPSSCLARPLAPPQVGISADLSAISTEPARVRPAKLVVPPQLDSHKVVSGDEWAVAWVGEWAAAWGDEWVVEWVA